MLHKDDVGDYSEPAMSHVLYRKYRSQIFDDLVGQEHVSSILKNAAAQDQVSHAYLFYGPRGLGIRRMEIRAIRAMRVLRSGKGSFST